MFYIEKKSNIYLALFATAFVLIVYGFVGSFGQVMQKKRIDSSQQIYLQMLDSVKQTSDIDNAILKVEARVNNNQDEIYGWLSLGQLYFAKENYNYAANSYGHVLDVFPGDLNVLVQYSKALLHANQGRVSEELFAAINKILVIDARNSAALHIMAAYYYQHKNFFDALKTWELLLGYDNISKSEVELIAKMQATAKEKFLADNPVKVAIVVKNKSKQKIVPKYMFAYVKASENSPPLWVKKIAITTWPIAVELNGLDAMFANVELPTNQQLYIGIRLSNQDKVEQSNSDITMHDKILVQTNNQPIEFTID